MSIIIFEKKKIFFELSKKTLNGRVIDGKVERAR